MLSSLGSLSFLFYDLVRVCMVAATLNESFRSEGNQEKTSSSFPYRTKKSLGYYITTYRSTYIPRISLSGARTPKISSHTFFQTFLIDRVSLPTRVRAVGWDVEENSSAL